MPDGATTARPAPHGLARLQDLPDARVVVVSSRDLRDRLAEALPDVVVLAGRGDWNWSALAGRRVVADDEGLAQAVLAAGAGAAEAFDGTEVSRALAGRVTGAEVEALIKRTVRPVRLPARELVDPAEQPRRTTPLPPPVDGLPPGGEPRPSRRKRRAATPNVPQSTDCRSSSELPEIWTKQLGFVPSVDAAWCAMTAANRPEWLFRFGGTLCRIVRDEHGNVVADPLDKAKTRAVLARVAHWMKPGDGGPIDIAPPMEIVEDLLATADPPLPALSGIVNAPVVAPDGTLMTEPGYHPSSRLLYRPDAGFSVPSVPEDPTAADVAEVRRLILDETLGDFPFSGPGNGRAEKAHAAALIIQASARQLIDGATPIYLIDKPTPGSGAGLLVDVASIIATGQPATATTEARDDDEMRKKLTSFLMAGKGVFFLDNVNMRVDSGALASAVTTKFWEDRVLGESRVVRVPVRNAWIIAGNNVRTSNEIARRCIRIRLDPMTDRPEERSGFRHENLAGWVSANRGRLVWAALTLVRAWIAAGRPEHGKTLGGFEAWCRTMGGILKVAGIPGFLGNLEDARDRADEEGAALRAFVTAWWIERYASTTSAADLFPIAQQVEPLLPLGDGNERSQKSRFGRLLARLRDRQFRIAPTEKSPEFQVRVEFVGVSHKAAQWQLAEVKPVRAGNFSPSETRSSPQSSPEKTVVNQGSGELGELGELFSDLRAREMTPDDTRMHAHARVWDHGKSSPSSPSSPNPIKSTGCGGELCGELLAGAPGSSPHPGGTAGQCDQIEEIEL